MGYMSKNTVITHDETSGNPGFTGINEIARFQYVGYPVIENTAGMYEGTEVIFAGSGSENPGGSLGVIGLASLPYHLAGMFEPLAEIGVSYQPLNFGPTAPTYTLLMDFANQSSTVGSAVFNQAPLTFPCQGATNVDYESSRAESPTPYINGQPTDLQAAPIGTPIAVVGNLNDTLQLTSGSLTTPSGSQITLNITSASSDPNHTLPPYAAFAFPTNPLSPNTTYMATITGTDNGNTFTRQFSFTTGNQGQF